MKLDINSGEDRAVSPVIGVILMVAITVILAAVIGTFVLGLGDSVDSGVNAGASVEQDASNNEIRITLTSAGNADGIAIQGDIDLDTSPLYTESVGGTITIDSDALSSDLSSGSTVNIIAYQGADLSDGDSLPDADQQTVIQSITTDFTIGS